MSTWKIFVSFHYGGLMGVAMMFLLKTKDDSFIVSPVVVEKCSSQEYTTLQNIDSPDVVEKYSSQKFKWKSFMTALQTASALGALKIIARSTFSETPIRVIRSRRNSSLDVYLSMLKQGQSLKCCCIRETRWVDSFGEVPTVRYERDQ